MINGIITKGIGGFYYIKSQGEIYECKARGKFRKDKVIPMVGDKVEIDPEDWDPDSYTMHCPQCGSELCSSMGHFSS